MKRQFAQNSSRLLSDSLLLGCILFLAFILRVWGIQFGLPDLYYADEPIVVNHALAYSSGDFNPHFFKIPPLMSYLLFVIYGVYFAVAKITGQISSAQDFAALFLSDPSSFYLLGRLIFGAGLGTITVFVFCRLIHRFFSRAHALISASFLAVAFLHVRDSHYIYADIPLVFVLVLAFFPILAILNKRKLRATDKSVIARDWPQSGLDRSNPRALRLLRRLRLLAMTIREAVLSGALKHYIIFGILLGIAVATKYNGVFICIPFLAAHFLNRKRAWNLSPLLLTGSVSLLVYAALNPFSLLDFKFFMRELNQQSAAEGGVGFFHHLTYSLNEGAGVTILFFSVMGIVRTLWSPDPKKWILLSFVVAYYLVLCFFSQPYDRYVLPLIPWVIFFASDFLVFLAGRYIFIRRFIWFIVLLIGLPSLVKVCLCNRILSEKDVRTMAKEWVEQNLPSGEKIALDVPFFMPRLEPTLGQLEQKRRKILSSSQPNNNQLRRLDLLISLAQKEKGKRYELYYLHSAAAGDGFLFSRPAVPYDLDHLRKAGIRNVVVAKINPKENSKFCEELQTKAGLLARLSPFKDENRRWAVDPLPLTGAPFLLKDLLSRHRNGQIIEIYRLEISNPT